MVKLASNFINKSAKSSLIFLNDASNLLKLCIEHAFAQGFQRISTIEKYEKKIGVNRNGEEDTDFPFE